MIGCYTENLECPPNIRRDQGVIFSTELYRPRIEGGEAPCVYVQASRGVAVTENDKLGDAINSCLRQLSCIACCYSALATAV